MDNFSDWLTLKCAGGQTDDTRSTFRPPLKTLGYKGSNKLLGRSVASRFWEWDFLNTANASFLFGKKGKLGLPVTQPETPSTSLCHIYSEPPGHEDSPGSI